MGGETIQVEPGEWALLIIQDDGRDLRLRFCIAFLTVTADDSL